MTTVQQVVLFYLVVTIGLAFAPSFLHAVGIHDRSGDGNKYFAWVLSGFCFFLLWCVLLGGHAYHAKTAISWNGVGLIGLGLATLALSAICWSRWGSPGWARRIARAYAVLFFTIGNVAAFMGIFA